MTAKVCAFTGHRAKKLPWGFDESDPRCLRLKAKLYSVVETLCETGINRFICGMANGCDLYFAEAVLMLQEHFPDIALEAAVPYPGQADRWSDREKRRYHDILSRCAAVTVVAPEYTRFCMIERNRLMVELCDVLLACYDEGSGGTLSTLRMAIREEREVIIVPIVGEELGVRS